MSVSAVDKTLAVMPEGPIAFDGERYRYSKGERIYLDNLAHCFKELVLVSFVYRPDDAMYEACAHSAFQARNIRVVELPFKGSFQLGVAAKLFQYLRVFFVLVRTLPKVDILYLFLPSYPSAMGWLIGRLTRMPHIVYAADDWEQATPGMFKWEHLRSGWFYKLYAHLNRSMERAIGRTALFNVTAGKKLLRKYQGFGPPVWETTPRIAITPADVFEREDTCQGAQITLINVGGLVYDKAQHILIESFSRVAAERDNLRLKIVGSGPREAELQNLVARFDLDKKVDFVGYVQEEKRLYELLRGADIFVLSSVSEGFPRALYEAMAMHLPIVTTDCGGIPDLMSDGVNACVVPAGSVKALARGVETVLCDGNLRRSMIRAGASTIDQMFERMDPAQIARLINAHLDQSH